jgi:hypothetical protein
MYKKEKCLLTSECLSLPTYRRGEHPPSTEPSQEVLVQLSFFVAHALYHHAGEGTLSQSNDRSSQLLSLIEGDLPEGSSSRPSRTMPNLSLAGVTSKQKNQISIGRVKGLSQVSQICIPHPNYLILTYYHLE